jgi:serine phosphatase RsbU (regulator of sigma subunit)
MLRSPNAAPPAEEEMLHALDLAPAAGEAGRRIVLGAAPLRIGRVPGNDLVLPSPEVSRNHCSLAVLGRRVMLTDLGSTNGTQVDGQKVAGARELADGARLRIGPYALTYRRVPRHVLERETEMERELGRAARYVQALLPPPLAEGSVRADWRFVPSVSVGGDGFGYRFLPDGRFAVWLLDVAGHGLDSALLAAAAMTMLRDGGLSGADPGDCGAVLAALDAAFDMDKHGGLFFTIWYGIYDPATRQLSHAAAGHHPAYLLLPGGTPQALGTRNPPIGAGGSGRPPQLGQVRLPPATRLHLFSDGAFETRLPDSTQNTMADFLPALAAPPEPGLPEPERLLRAARRLAGGAAFEDDVSILVLDFP